VAADVIAATPSPPPPWRPLSLLSSGRWPSNVARQTKRVGFCSGAVAGLGRHYRRVRLVTVSGAVIIGILAGLIPFFAVWKLKAMLGYDDALDTFGVHAVRRTLGALLTGMLGRHESNGESGDDLKDKSPARSCSPWFLSSSRRSW